MAARLASCFKVVIKHNRVNMRTLPFSLLCYGLVLGLQLTAVLSDESCGVIGTDSKSTVPVSIDHHFVLNTRDTAKCNGTVFSYEYCYHSSVDAINQSQYFSFAVFREDGTVYMRSSNITNVASTMIVTSTSSSDLTCVKNNLMSPLPVNAGDMFGACIAAGFNVVGNDSDKDSSSVLYVANDSACQNGVPSMLNKDDLKPNDGLVLHLYATVTKFNNEMLTPEQITAIVVPLITIFLVAIFLVLCFWLCKKTPRKSSSSEHLFSSGSPGFDNVGYCDVPSAQPLLANSRKNSTRNSKVNTVHVDSATYEVMDSEPSSLLYTPPHTSGESGNDTALDSGSYAQVRTSPIRKPSGRVRTATVNSITESTQRPVYEFECSRSRGVSFECSFENVSHVEPLMTGGDYIRPVDTLSGPVTIKQLLEMNKEEDIYSNVDPYQRPASKEEELMTQLTSCGVVTLTEDKIEVQANIGMGQFGTVHKGVWNERGKITSVALKSLKQGSSNEDKVMFLQEAVIMAQFRHPNITMLYGVVTDSQPMMLVAELAAKGDLRNLLLSIRPKHGETPPNELRMLLLQFSQQVALGMQYLSAKGFVHRDLAARNVLVSRMNVCKVADFGLSRDLADENYYVSHGKDKIPVKWTAPEAIQFKKYSTASDVWSYGCLLYEIWSLAHKPFEGVTNIQVLRVINTGRRLPPPPGCPKMIYQLMILSWHPETSERPTFRDVVLTLVGDEAVVLNIPEEDSSTNPLAGILGAPLEAGENMYSEEFRRHLEANA